MTHSEIGTYKKSRSATFCSGGLSHWSDDRECCMSLISAKVVEQTRSDVMRSEEGLNIFETLE